MCLEQLKGVIVDVLAQSAELEVDFGHLCT